MSQELFDRILDGEHLTKNEIKDFKNFIATDEGNDLLEEVWIKAAEEGDIDVLEILLGFGVKVNLTTITGLTALTTAAENDQEDCIEFLLQHGANIDQPDEWENTALMLAVSNGWQSCLQILLEHKPALYLTDSGGSTALNLAEENQDEESIQLLLAYSLFQGDDNLLLEESQPPAKRVKIEEDVTHIIGDTEGHASDSE